MPRLLLRALAAALGLCAPLAPVSLRAQSDAIVTITPMYGSWSGTTATHAVEVMITWCSPDGMLGTRTITLDGQAVSLSFHPGYDPSCTSYGESNGTVVLTPGSHTLRAENRVGGVLRGYAQSTYLFTQLPDARVTPDAPSVSVAAGTGQAARFRVVNTGQMSATWSLAALCTGASACSPSQGSAQLAPGDSAIVTVPYTAPASGSGQVQLTATSGSVSRTGTVSVATFVVGVRVTPEPAAVTVAGNTSQLGRFRVVNTGGGETTFTLTRSCTNTTACYVSGHDYSRTLPAGDSTYVEVAYQSPVSGAAQVRLTASAGSASSQGVVSVTATAVPPVGFPGDSAGLMRIERSACVTVAIGPGAAYECGDLRVVHPLPGVRVLNRARAPVLVYNSQHAQPYPIVAEQLTPRAGTAPDSVVAVLTLNGEQSRGAWPAWGAGEVRHVSVAANAATLATGVYPYTLEVRSQWNGGASEVIRSRSGRLLVVNRIDSPFGPGWWLAGVERIHHVSGGDTLKLWVGGDGSARLYRGAAGGPWVADPFARADTLRRVGTEYLRRLPGGAEVWFDATGHHARTRNAVGHTTTFTWATFATDRKRLASMTLPAGSGAPEALQYLFEYGNNTATATPRLSRVRAPAPMSGYRDTYVGTDGQGRPTRITDVDGRYVGFTYGPTATPFWMRTRTDRKGRLQQFNYATYRLRSSLRFPEAGDTIRHTFFPAEARNLTAPLTPDLFRTSLHGPRGQVGNMPDNFHWYVNQWGAPIRTRMPGSAGWVVTEIAYGDARWPALPTQVVAPNGLLTTAAYDARGNLAAQTTWNPYGDGRNAATTYAWDPVWDAVTRVVLPEGETSTFAYDGYGRRSWERVAGDPQRQVTYGYHPVTHATAPGLLASVVHPLSGTETVEYDVRGNLAASVATTGARTEYWADRIGRDTLADAPVHGTRRLRSRTAYDAMDRDSLGVSFGDPAEGDLHVESWYDADGLPITVTRWSVPDHASVSKVRRGWGYDGAGRQAEEWDETVTPLRLRLDRAGNAVQTITRRGDTIRTTFDAMSRPVQRIVPRVEYDPLVWQLTENGSGTYLKSDTFPHPGYADAVGRFVIPADTTVFRYHPQSGLLIAADNRDARVRRGYYPNGQLRADTLQIRTWAEAGAPGGSFTTHEYVLEYTYDLNGRRTSLTVPANVAPRNANLQPVYRVQQYGYDRTTGALAYVRNVLGQEYRFTYDREGRIERIDHPGQRWETYTYDGAGRLLRRLVRSPNFAPETGSDLVLRDTFTSYQDDGRVSRMRTTGYDVGAWHEFEYTRLGRLRQATRTLSGSGGPEGPFRGEQYTWDALGNRIENLQTSLMSPSYPSVARYFYGTNRVRYSGPPAGVQHSGVPTNISYYDAAGNVHLFSLSNTDCTGDGCTSGTTEHRVTRSYYGADDQLRASDGSTCFSRFDFFYPSTPFCEGPATLSNSRAGAFEWYRYDGLGRRVLVRTRRDHTCTNGQACTSELTRYLWDGDQLLAEIRTDGGNVSAQVLENDRPAGTEHGSVLYTHGPALDRPLDIIRMGLYASAWGDAYPVHPIADFRGGFVDGADADGKRLPCGNGPCVIVWPKFSAFYTQRATQTNFFGSLVNGKEDASGFTYMRNRYYNPHTGAFTQSDPIGLAGGLNTYGFAEGDPVSYSDPYGLNPCENLGYLLKSICDRAVDAALGAAEGAIRAANSTLDFIGIGGVGEAATGLDASEAGRRLSAGERAGALVVAGASSMPLGRGLRGASVGLRSLFTSSGGLSGNTVIGIRTVLRENGFSMTVARNKGGYLFQNAAGEEVRVMRGANGWYLRARNAAGNYLDAQGNPGTRATTHIPLVNH